MVGRGLRRIVGGVSVFAMAAGFAATVGVASAAAASESVSWSNASTHIKRTIDDTTVSVGQIIEVKTRFERSGSVVTFKEVWDYKPSCLEFVSSNKSNPRVESDYTYVSGSWAVWPNISNTSETFTFRYEVTEDCARDTQLSTGVKYRSGLRTGDFRTKGPTFTVAKNTTTTSLAAVPGPVVAGDPVTLTATVTGGAKNDPVDFYDGGTKVGSGQLNSSGVATYEWTPPDGGTRSLQAKFPSTAKAKSSQSGTQDVTVTDVVTSLDVSAPGTATTGEPVELTAAVLPVEAQGTVQFFDGDAPVGDPIEVANGAASVPHTFAAAGEYTVAAEFTGGPGFTNASAAPVTVAVSDLVTSLEVSAPDTAITGEPVELSAQVSPIDAQGTVQFFDGDAPIGGPVEVFGGAAGVPHTFAAAGEYSITAEFTGAPGFTNASGAPVTVAVSEPDVVTSLEIQLSGTATTGEPVALLAQVSPVPSGGTVQLKVDGVDVGAPVEVDDSGRAILPYTFDAAGSYAVSAEYSGTPGFARSQAAVTVTVADPADDVSSVVITSSPAATAGVPFTLKARVLPEDAAGTVQFFDGDAEIGDPVEVVDGVAELVYTFDSVGPHEIHVVYSGGPGVEGSTSQMQVLDVSESGDADTSSLGSLDIADIAGIAGVLGVLGSLGDL
ncbi:Ig-like domain-containing protein [Rhodococcus spongiicola]|uniref:Ig-like domain repeat protein n=1 Tax=Rhodococcus spongiicola TaxID=2487352 RepID=A0A438AU72_9NOCA|nr:Ig-like domain-containing protein [Rhodococcus spongiicola]RVW02246.1 Ig-like domain repeat protein [Rhodococcus spongiicola]